MTLTRRRFLVISAASLAMAGSGQAASLYRWKGSALGARATITLTHPEAARITAAARAEIDRLEDVFSLYRSQSALSRLNAAGYLDAPPFELLECLSLAGALHHATDGFFDPTVQPLWSLYARSHAAGRAPDVSAIAMAHARCGWDRVAIETGSIRLRPGMALTLNGIAQGYIADRVTALLEAEGLTDILIDTGELRALGGHPHGDAWPVTLDLPAKPLVGLRDRALASSAPLGTTFDAEGKVGHILDPRTGRPAAPVWQLVSVSADSAAMADALSTAMCLMSRDRIHETLKRLPGAKLMQLAART